MDIKYIKRIDTGDKSRVYIDGQTIDFILPKNKIDLSTFKIYYDVFIDPVYRYNKVVDSKEETYLKRFMPRLSSSIIDTLTIRKSGVVLQEIKDYNIIANILNDAMKEEDDLDGDKPDTLNYTTVSSKNQPIKVCDFINTAIPEAIEPLTYRYYINSFLGLINESSSSILDASKDEYMISIKLAPKHITYRGLDVHDAVINATNVAETYPVDYHYRISNVFANIDVLPHSTNAPTVVNFKHYKAIKATQTDTKDAQIIHKHKGKLDYILSTFIVAGNHDTGLQLDKCNDDSAIFSKKIRKTYADIQGLADVGVSTENVSSKLIKSLTTVNNLDNSLYFSRQAFNMRASQYTCNGLDICPLMDMSQIYGQAMTFFGNRMTRVQSLASFETEFFVFPMTIGQTDENYVSQIEWKSFAGNKTADSLIFYENKEKVYPIMFLCYDEKVSL